jgi:hypothetical protein
MADSISEFYRTPLSVKEPEGGGEEETQEEVEEESQEEEKSLETGQEEDKTDEKREKDLDAEARRKMWQSRADKAASENNILKAQLADVQAKLKQLTEQKDSNELDDLFKGQEKGDIVTTEQLQAVIEKLNTVKKPAQKADQSSDALWMQSQPDYQNVMVYFDALRQQNPNIVASIPGKTGKQQYESLRAWMREDEINLMAQKNAEMEAKLKELTETKKRSKLPTSGPGRGTVGGTRSSGENIDVPAFFRQDWNTIE